MTARIAALCVLSLIASSPLRAEEHVVKEKDKQFSQPAIRIRRNDSIRFVNDDTIAHNVFARSSVADFNVTLQVPGSSDVVRFPKTGVVEVRCAIHPGMKIKVEVTP